MNKNTETAVTVPAAFDFATRDVAAKAEAGADLEVLDPVTGEAVGVSHDRQAPHEQREGLPQPGS